MLAAATQRLEQDERRTVLFLDEIHRFTKAQQDGLLPGVERGTVILVGATTENPFFEVNSPLISRSTLFRLESLTPPEVESLLDRVFIDERGITEPAGITPERVPSSPSGAEATLVSLSTLSRWRRSSPRGEENPQSGCQRWKRPCSNGLSATTASATSTTT